MMEQTKSHIQALETVFFYFKMRGIDITRWFKGEPRWHKGAIHNYSAEIKSKNKNYTVNKTMAFKNCYWYILTL